MVENSYAPDSLRLRHGMEHAGLGKAALAIERSRAFKKAFVEAISRPSGLESIEPELVGSGIEGLEEYLGKFGEDGHAPEEATRAFLDGLLASAASQSGTASTGEMVRDCCIRWPPDWLNCGGYLLELDGEPWTIEGAVAAYEKEAGVIADSAVRAELARIRVYLQIEWEIPV